MNEDKSKQISMMPPPELWSFPLHEPPDRETFNIVVKLAYNDLNAPKVTEEEYAKNLNAIMDFAESKGYTLLTSPLGKSLTRQLRRR